MKKGFQLSKEQMRLWIESRRNPESALLHIHRLYRFTGKLDVLWFQKCVQSILESEPIFNTYFSVTDGIPSFLFKKYNKHHVKHINLSTHKKLSNTNQEIRYIENRAHMPIDLLSLPN